MAPGPITKYFMGGHLIVLRKLLSQKSEHERENDGVNQSGGWTGLSRHEHALRSWWKRQKHAWAQHQKEHGGHNEISSGQHETHGLGDQRVHEEEHESVEQHRSASSETVAELNTCTVRAKQNTWAEREKECGGDRNFLGRDIWKHICIMYIL